MEKMEIFLQVEGVRKIELIHVSKAATVQNIIEAGKAKGLIKGGEGHVVFLENAENELEPALALEAAGIKHRGRVHVHRCRKLQVTVNFNGKAESNHFSPATTIDKVKRWAVSKEVFNLSEIDASEHILQICGSNERPDEDTHLGSLVKYPDCKICFDLVAKVRVEG